MSRSDVTAEKEITKEEDAVNFLIWVRTEDYYFVRKQQRWFNSQGDLLTERELLDKYLNKC